MCHKYGNLKNTQSSPCMYLTNMFATDSCIRLGSVDDKLESLVRRSSGVVCRVNWL